MSSAVDRLERDRPDEPFCVELRDGTVVRLRDARDVAARDLLQGPVELAAAVMPVGTLLSDLPVDLSDIEVIVDLYCDHYGLGLVGEALELVWVLDRYLGEVTYDLAGLGLDVPTLWRQRRWGLLWTVMIRLPRNSLTKEKLLDDDEFVSRSWPEDAEESAPVAIRVSEFSPEVAALYDVIDRLGEVCSTVIGAAGGKPRRVKPIRRPITAFERVKNRRRREAHQRLVARVLPSE